LSGISHAVFLSYASQDAEAAQRICEALRAVGIEVFLDQSELRGGDVWDQKIRREIHDCALFVPIISQRTQERLEGYFRREWKLAIDRTHDMAEQKPFLVPVVIDGTSDQEAIVPDAFRSVQWTRLPTGETPPEFAKRIQQLLLGVVSSPLTVVGRPSSVASGEASRAKPAWFAIIVVLAAVAGYLLFEKPWIAMPATPLAFAPPPHSIAVLPFVNLSGDASQEYFSDGLTEELLNSLASIEGLQVAARTSSFSFREHPDIVTVAHKLNVASVLEGSVRRSEHTVRVNAQLINALTGFHLWSKTYDRDLGDVLKLQTEIATAVAEALKVTLLGDVAAKIELGGTRNPAAFDAYLRASKAFLTRRDAKDIPDAIAMYTEAIRLDPNYALAFAYRSFAMTTYAADQTTEAAIRESCEKAEADARRAIALAPGLAEAHLALGYVLWSGSLDFARAGEAYDRARTLAPGKLQVLLVSSEFDTSMGHFDAAIAAARRAVVLDPLDRRSHSMLGRALYAARRYGEAAAAQAEAIRVNPDYTVAYAERGLAFYGLGDLEGARASCETKRNDWVSQLCLAVVYDKLGRHADAEAELAKVRAAQGDASAYPYATIYAQWGDRLKALEWLEAAMRVRDPDLSALKTDPLLDPLREEPRFQAIERELKFPT
jgi:TolB-like protein/cytochrome c-type biogenesis protein CcmH/NrfG